MEETERVALEGQFSQRLLDAVNEVRSKTRVGVSTIREEISKAGGLRTAKLYLCLDDPSTFWPQQELDSGYFEAAKRVGRIDLSVESLALNATWAPLFTREELSVARVRLGRNGFDPDCLGNYPTAGSEIVASLPIERTLALPDRSWHG